jgi:uncharacterized RDD family membrane protein YckC
MRTCDYCGRENPDDAFSCAGCASQLQEEAPVIKQTKAGFWIRAAARIMDLAFVILLASFTIEVMGGALVAADRAGLIPSDWLRRMHGLSLLMLLFNVLASILYHSFCEGLYGATPGKLCCGIRVVSEDGTPSNMKGALIRTLAYQFVDTLLFGAAGYTAMRKSPLNQRYGDIWGKTAVIKTSEMAPESKRSQERLLLALGLGVISYMVMVALGLLLKIWETPN